MEPFDWEMTLPPYLKKDINALVAVEKKKPLPTNWDCYYNELQGSINSAQWDNEITIEQAQALREKYL